MQRPRFPHRVSRANGGTDGRIACGCHPRPNAADTAPSRAVAAATTTERRDLPEGLAGGLPDLLLVGAMTCGMTSLHHHLGLHPEICMAVEKKLHCFTPRLGDGHSLQWHRSRFATEKPIRGESSTSSTKHLTFPGVAERIHALLPDARLISMVRDPVGRMVSH